MLKKLSIAGLALLASSGIAFADPSDTNTVSDNSSSSTDASMNNAAGDTTATTTTTTTTVHKKHKKHHHKKHHRHHHQAAQMAPADDAMMASAPKGDYKGEVAAPCPTCPVPFHPGAYVGLSVGSLLNYASRPAIYNGLQGTLFGGYGWMWDQWYGALELFVQDSAQITNYTNNSGNGNVSSSWGYGLSVLPGYMIVDNVLGFLRLGVVETHFNSGSNQWRTGGQIGLGLDTALCTNWDLRGEYIYSFYNSLSNSYGLPRSQQFNLGLIYKFEL